MNTDHLELLIYRYGDAIRFGTPQNIATLAAAVEAEADRIGYPHHRRLQALHTLAEKACERAEQ